MTIIDKLLALRALPPFDQVREAEIVLIAGVCQPRQYAPHAIVCSPEKRLQKLHIVIGGRVAGEKTPGDLKIIGAPQLLYHLTCVDTYRAAEDGATCLLINKGNFFTIVNECPSLITGFMALNLPFEACR
jgi:hypothetical protein